MSVDTVISLLQENGFDSDMQNIFRKNLIDEETLLDLNNQDMDELGIHALKHRKLLRKMIDDIKRRISTVNNSAAEKEFRRVDNRLYLSHDNELGEMGDISLNETLTDGVGTLDESDYDHQSPDLKMDQSCESGDNDLSCQGSSSRTSTPNPKFPMKIMQSVPDRLAGWENDFTIPTQYSEQTMFCLTTGQLNPTARKEIIQAAGHKIMNHCKYPTVKQIEVVAYKIVQFTGKAGQDKFGIGYETWAKSLEERIRNQRRRTKSMKLGAEVDEPRRKKRKVIKDNHYNQSAEHLVLLDKAAFQRLQKALVQEWSRHRRNLNDVKRIFEELRPNRRECIVKERKMVHDIKEMFPPLEDFDFLVLDFCHIIGCETESLEENVKERWQDWEKRMLSYSNTFRNKVVQELLESLESNREGNVVKIMNSLLDKKKNSCNHVMVSLSDTNVDQTAQESTVTNPYIIKCNPKQYFIVVERQIYMEVHCFVKAIISMMALYYTYDIGYPKECSNTLLCIEKLILGITSGPGLSKGALTVVTDIQNRQI